VPYIPDHIYDYFKTHPTATTGDLRKEFNVSGRSSRRWAQYFRNGYTPQKAVRSAAYDQYEQFTDEEATFSPQAWLEDMQRQADRALRADPVITTDVFTISTDGPFVFVPFSCMHLGGRYTAYKEFKVVYDWLLNRPNVYVGSLGDDIEGFHAQFPDAAAIQDQLLNVEEQLEVLKFIMEPLTSTGRLLFGCGSQHGGDWTKRKQGHNPIKKMYLDFGVPFYDGPAYVKFKVGPQEYHVALGHQFPGNSMYNPNHPQMRALRFRFPLADAVIMGDKHITAVQKAPSYPDEVEMGNRQSPVTWLVQVGTAKTGPDPYTVRGGWHKGMLGWPAMLFHADKHRLEVFDYYDTVDKVLGYGV